MNLEELEAKIPPAVRRTVAVILMLPFLALCALHHMTLVTVVAALVAVVGAALLAPDLAEHLARRAESLLWSTHVGEKRPKDKEPDSARPLERGLKRDDEKA